jgi:hypothetical protein
LNKLCKIMKIFMEVGLTKSVSKKYTK